MVPSQPELIENIIVNANIKDYFQACHSFQNLPRNDSFKSTTSTKICSR